MTGMTQPHYMDREAVLERLRALDFLGHYDEARFQYIADDILALAVAPMEAVAWRWRFVEGQRAGKWFVANSLPYGLEGVTENQALYAHPVQGGEG